uniref:NADH-ubiquinone oxidoreductase chain 2 n=1 Tax=Auritibicen bihamatus TaxID=1760999 RepID=A0A344ALB1_9HEMI|nr:NADH dehydrogenase subunit 2 [Auritibicen bihamatus]
MSSNSSNMLFLTFMMMGILISISSNNWLGCWMGIEINLISFLPIMIDSVSVYSSESSIKYFIIQSMGSSLFFISIIFFNLFNIIYLTMLSLMIKIGCPPFHLWFPSVMEGLSWGNCFILSTFQKLVPMILLSYLDLNMTLFVILSSVWGAIGGLSYSSMRKIISYSSIYNLGWMLSGLMISDYLWLMYFVIYSITLMMMCYLFHVYGVNYLNQFFVLNSNFVKSILTMIIFMSMGGMPPFLGFLPKLIMIHNILMSKMVFLCMILIFSTLLVMFFYLRVVFTGLMINFLSMKFVIINFSWHVYMFGMISLFGIELIYLLNLCF